VHHRVRDTPDSIRITLSKWDVRFRLASRRGRQCETSKASATSGVHFGGALALTAASSRHFLRMESAVPSKLWKIVFRSTQSGAVLILGRTIPGGCDDVCHTGQEDGSQRKDATRRAKNGALVYNLVYNKWDLEVPNESFQIRGLSALAAAGGFVSGRPGSVLPRSA